MKLLKHNSLILGFILVLMTNITDLKAQTNQFRIVGYVPNWIDVAAFIQNFDFNQVTHVNYAFQNPDASGNLVESNNGLTALVAKAHQNNVKVLISLGGGGAPASSGTVKTYFQNLISTSDKRAAFIRKIVVYLNKYQLNGLDVDEEGPAIDSNYGAFIKQLSDSLKPKGKLLTAAVGWGGEKIQNSTLSLFDWVSLMAYDYTGSWDLTHPGQHSPYWYAQQMINDWKKRGVKKENLCLGVPFYGYGFYKSVGSYSYNTILTKYPEAWQSDQAGDTIYYNGINTMRKKTKLAMAEASGIMIWELSQDTKGDKSLLKSISSTVDSLNTSVLATLPKVPEMIIYPNPAIDYIVIENLPSSKNATVEVFDIQGRLVKTVRLQLFESEGVRIDLLSMNKGLYICRVTSPEGISAQLFMKE